MKRFGAILTVVMFSLGLALYGCATQSSKPMTAKELVAQARKTVSEVSVSTAKEAFDRGGYLFLDCREPREYKMGHIPGAINIPRGLIEFKVTKKIPDKNTKILVYCKFGGRGCLTACTLCLQTLQAVGWPGKRRDILLNKNLL